MKKIIACLGATILSATLAIAFAGCSSAPDLTPPAQNGNGESVSEEVEPTPVSALATEKKYYDEITEDAGDRPYFLFHADGTGEYYYYEYPTVKYAKQYPADHNDVIVERGKWRKFNPYKPYVEDEEPAKNNTIQSIDSMLEEEPQQPKAGNSNNNVGYDEPINISNIGNEEEQPQKPSKRDDFEELDVDVQKELEAKFDEIFGAFDNNETTSNT